MLNARLALGTVQFGLAYGVANRTGKVDNAEAQAILRQARAAGIDTLDTAIAYGDSEQRLGEIGVEQFRIVSKLPGLPEDLDDVDRWVEDQVAASLKRLRTENLYALLLHRPRDLLRPNGDALQRAMRKQVSRGVVQRIGLSIYAPDELDLLYARFRPDIVQAPFNVIDRRLQTTGWLERLREGHTEIHVRSVFLQGLLLMAPHERPTRFERWESVWDSWDSWLKKEGVSPLHACLGFVLAHPEIDRAVIGVDNAAQLRQTIGAAKLPPKVPPSEMSSQQPELVDPSLWSAA